MVKMVGKWLGGLLLVLLLVLLVLVHANRDVDRPTVPQQEAALERAVQWLLAHRSVVIAEPNPGLWWMVRTAGEVRRDARLLQLVQASSQQAFPPELRQDVWMRMWQPDAPIDVAAVPPGPLSDYQEGFISALSCGETERQWGHAPGWRQSNQCRPALGGLIGLNRWCATHQLMGLKLLQEHRCPAAMQPPAGLVAALQADIALLMWLDPTMKDASLQRVLMLGWTRGMSTVPAIWLHRVLDSQQTDGGWQGNTQIAGGPNWLQPMWWHNVLARHLPLAPVDASSGFHPTAQGLLILALSVQAQTGSATALGR